MAYRATVRDMPQPEIAAPPGRVKAAAIKLGVA